MAKQELQTAQKVLKVAEAIKAAREAGKGRNFKQTFELIVNLQNIDVEKSPFDMEYALPKGRGRPISIGIVADMLVPKAKALSDFVIDKGTLQSMDKKSGKKLANKCEFFIAEISLMPIVGKILGPVLGPRGKMPKPLPPQANLEALVSNLKKTIRLRAKKSPIIHAIVGIESMSDDEIEENVRGVVDFLLHNLPRGKDQIKNAYLKLTMGEPIKFEAK